MGRLKIDLDMLRPKDKINTTFNKRKEGLKNKAKQLGQLCGCEVALIIIPPKGCNDNEVIDVSINGTVLEIFQKYSVIQQRDPGREQAIYIPESPIPLSASSATQGQQPVQANLERNEYAPSSSAGPQIQQQLQGSLEVNDYVTSMAPATQPVFMDTNDHVGLNDQVQMQQMQRCLHHPMQGMQHNNLQHRNFQHHIPQNGTPIPLHNSNHVPMHHCHHIPPQHGPGTNYMPMAKHQRTTQLLQHNNMTALLHQQPAQHNAQYYEGAMTHDPTSGYVGFPQTAHSTPDSDNTIDDIFPYSSA